MQRFVTATKLFGTLSIKQIYMAGCRLSNQTCQQVCIGAGLVKHVHYGCIQVDAASSLKCVCGLFMIMTDGSILGCAYQRGFCKTVVAGAGSAGQSGVFCWDAMCVLVCRNEERLASRLY